MRIIICIAIGCIFVSFSLAGDLASWVNKQGMKFAVIKAGKFTNSEAVQKSVDKSFSLGVTEVTQEQWFRVMGENQSYSKGKKLPVNGMKLSQVQEFCRKLSALDGKIYRLPTVTEWEMACYANHKSYTDKQVFNMAWVLESFKDGQKVELMNVAMKESNSWGFYDMLGNVEELCQSVDVRTQQVRYIFKGGSFMNFVLPRPSTKGVEFIKEDDYIYGFPFYGLRLACDHVDTK